MNITDNNTDDTIEYRIFEDVIASQCLMHDIKTKFVHNQKCYKQKQKLQSTNIGQIVSDRYCNNDCAHSMNSSQKSMVNKNIDREAIDENRHYDI